MKASFVPSLSGREILSGVIGDLVVVADAALVNVFSGDSLAAIRAEKGIVESPAGRVARQAAQDAARAAFVAARAQMHAIFAALPPITRARLLDEFTTINSALDRGDLQASRIRVAAVERPADSELTAEEFAQRKAAMLALFPQ